MQISSNIKVSDTIHLDQITTDDTGDLVQFMNDRDIYRNTLQIPYPYKYSDADFWVQQVEQNAKKYDFLSDWTIRKNGKLIGGISITNPLELNLNKCEIGYWIAKAHRNNGIMTKTVRAFCDFCFNELQVEEIRAMVYTHNPASAKVLEKAGFVFKRELLNAVEKEGTKKNVLLYVNRNYKL